MRILLFGNTGTGKTKYLTFLAVNRMLDTILSQDLFNSYDMVDSYNSQGFNFSKNYEHLVFTNIPINTIGFEIPNLESYLINPFKIGLFDKDYKTDFFPPFTEFFITELQLFYSSDNWDKLRPCVKEYWQTARQWGISLTADCQRPMDIAKPIRELFDIFIEFLDNEEVLKGGKLVHKWCVRIIKGGNRVLEEYLRTNNKVLYDEKTIYSDDIYYNNYDTNFMRKLHLIGRRKQDFSITQKEVEELYKQPNNFLKNVKNNNENIEMGVY